MGTGLCVESIIFKRQTQNRNQSKGEGADVQKKMEKLKYKPELCKVAHLDFSHASQNLHHVKAFVCLEPTGGEESRKTE